MAKIKEDLTKDKRIEQEVKRLNKILKEVDDKDKKVVAGLIDRASSLRIAIEDMEKDLNENGYTTLFQQGKEEPYERERPTARLYNSMSMNYAKIIKQISDLMPKKIKTPEKGDDFDEFIKSK